MPERTKWQTARLWIISLCGAVPGTIVVYLTQNYFAGAAVFLAVVMVLGFGVYLYGKRKKQ